MHWARTAPPIRCRAGRSTPGLLQADVQTFIPEELLDFTDAKGSEMEHRRGQEDGGATIDHGLVEMLQLAGTAGGHDRNRHDIGNGPREFQIVTRQGAVAIHTRGQNHTGAQFLALAGLGDSIFSHRFCPSGHNEFKSRRQRGIASGIDGHGDLF